MFLSKPFINIYRNFFNPKFKFRITLNFINFVRKTDKLNINKFWVEKNIILKIEMFFLKHLLAIILLMSATFYIGYWFGKHRDYVKNFYKKYIKKIS